MHQGSPRQYRLSARCPECSAPVRLRNLSKAIDIFLLAMERGELDPDEVLQTYQCSRRLPDRELCNTIVKIKARHWSEVEL